MNGSGWLDSDMPNPVFLPTALQQAGIPDNQTGVPVRPSFIQAPLPTGFDNNRRPFLNRVAATVFRHQPGMGSMYLCQGNPAQRFTTTFWLAACNTYRTRAVSRTIGAVHQTHTDDQDPITLFPTVVETGIIPPGNTFQIPSFDFRTLADPTPYDQVSTNPATTTQDVTGAVFNDTVNDIHVTQSLSGGEVPRVYVDDMRSFILGLPLTALWGTSPPTIFQNYFCNTFPAELGDFSAGFIPGLSISNFAFDITNLAANMAAEGAYAYDAVYYPINSPGQQVLPGAPGFGTDVGEVQGLSTFGIIGDISRCRVGGHALCASSAASIGSNVLSREALFLDRVQMMTRVTIRATIIEQAYAYYGAGAITLIRKIRDQNLYAGQIFEIPQSSFRDPYVSNAGPGPSVIHSSDIIVIFNSTVEAYYAHYGAPPTAFLVDAF